MASIDFENLSTVIQPHVQKLIDSYRLSIKDVHEPLFEGGRFFSFPYDPRYEHLLENLRRQQKAFWTADEIDVTKDCQAVSILPKTIKDYLEEIMAFFLVADDIVGKNLAENMIPQFTLNEVVEVYKWQEVIERIHAITYSKVFHAIITDKSRQEELKNSSKTSDFVRLKSNWAKKWISAGVPPAILCLAFACVEIIFFQGQFAMVQWIVDQTNGKAIGLSKSNEFISRDEGEHGLFAIALLNCLQVPVPSELVEAIVREAAELEKHCVDLAMKHEFLGMNKQLLKQFLECVADSTYRDITNSSILLYGSKNPFDFYSMISNKHVRTNFFESTPTTYQASNVKPIDKPVDLSIMMKQYREQQQRRQTHLLKGTLE